LCGDDLAIDDVTRPDVWNAILTLITGLNYSVRDNRSISNDASQWSNLPTVRVRFGIAEHVKEDGLWDGIKTSNGIAPLGSQRICLIENVRNPPLLWQGWKRNGEAKQRFSTN
jgi:hypothetical protein